MRVRIIIPPDPLVTWEEADAHLKLDGDTDQEDLVQGMIAAVCSHIDGPNGWLRRAIGPQTLEARGEGFWPNGYRLPYPPLIRVASLKYVDGQGTLQTVDPSLYEADDREVLPAFGAAWPSPRASRNSVQLRYVAGYAVSALDLTPAVPPAIKQAVLLMVGDLYRFRETAVVGTIAADIPMSATVANLLAPYRVFS